MNAVLDLQILTTDDSAEPEIALALSSSISNHCTAAIDA
ncbi:class III lanthipeptide [Streptomyces maremycinicus]|nr:class III lanthipeptide [Streptomyces sp. NBRC 110468]